jgi:uncharacterized protein (DUF1499 family)
MKIIFGLLIFLCFAVLIILGTIKNNRIPEGLGVIDGKLAEVPLSPNAVSSQTEQLDKRVEPFPFRNDFPQSRQRILSIIKHYPGAHLITDTQDYLHVVFVMPIIPFKDDVEFLFDRQSQLIHYRSASRVGYSDLGVNKKRYQEIRLLYFNSPAVPAVDDAVLFPAAKIKEPVPG